MHHVYQLTIDGDTEHIYIGVTQHPKHRYEYHVRRNQPNTPKGRWIRNAREHHLFVRLTLLSSWPNRADALAEETRLIRAHRTTHTVLNDVDCASDAPRRRTPEGRRRTGDANRIHRSKQWTVTTPDGDTSVITNMTQYCRDHGLSGPAMSNVSLGRQHHHKGYTCRKLTN